MDNHDRELASETEQKHHPEELGPNELVERDATSCHCGENQGRDGASLAANISKFAGTMVGATIASLIFLFSRF